MPSIFGFGRVNAPAPINVATPAAAPANLSYVRTAAEFNAKVLQARGPVLVEFMSEACGHCRRAQPMVEDVARQLNGKMPVYQVSLLTEEGQALAQQFGVMGTPTFVTFKGGGELQRVVGAIPD